MKSIPYERVENPANLAQRAAKIIAEEAAVAIGERGQFSIALSGGETPKRIFANLAAGAFSPAFDWSRCHIFWGDERCVAQDDPESNYFSAYLGFLRDVPVPEAHIHRMPGDQADRQAAALAYEDELRAFFPSVPFPRFDVVLQGLGPDGHTASLFPNHPALSETRRWCLDVSVAARIPHRLTLTLPVLNAARLALLLASGEQKRAVVSRILEGDPRVDELPAARIRPENGRLLWLCDGSVFNAENQLALALKI